MKAIILNKAGAAENLEIIDTEKPILKATEVLVKNISLSINPVDVKSRANEDILDWLFGKERPVILGWDVSGIVTELGKEVTDFNIGDEVFGMVNFLGNGKAYAEYIASPQEHLALKPKNISHEAAAASTLTAITAYQALVDVAKIKKGDRVLIHAASGGVGHFAVQIAKSFGAYVIGTSSGKNKAFVLSLGSDEHIDYTQEKFEEKIKDIDIVIDTIGGETLSKSIQVTKNQGTIVTLPSHEFSDEQKLKAIQKNISLQFLMVQSKKETISEIAKMLENKTILPHIHKIFSFDEMAKAHQEVESNHVVGKVVVNV
ncbi:MAG: NADP-dependent oxidoreductase [Arachidicoccus sp.]|nr:NADP-dependent oxidoreductase [Arachidicoccus sp.]